MRVLLLSIACLATLASCMGQEFKDRASFTVDVSGLESFQLYNRRGAVTVKAVSGNTATMQVERSLRAKSAEKLETAKKEIYMDKMERDGQVIFFIQTPHLRLEFSDDGQYAYYNSRRNGDWGWNNSDDEDYVKAEFTITLEIPASTNLVVVNHEHPLQVSGMQGNLIARNHHDGVLVENQGGNADVHSHHGDVEVFYTKNPTRECRYDTHHGDIRVHYQKGLAVNANLYSYHGEFFTEFDWSMQPMTVANEAGSHGAKYKIAGKSGSNVKIGAGGPMQFFKTHHGDVFLLGK